MIDIGPLMKESIVSPLLQGLGSAPYVRWLHARETEVYRPGAVAWQMVSTDRASEVDQAEAVAVEVLG